MPRWPLAGGAGLFLPPGSRSGVVLALLAGAGVGIAGLALGSSSFAAGDPEAWWRVFFVSSIAGFATVAAGLRWRGGGPGPAGSRAADAAEGLGTLALEVEERHRDDGRGHLAALALDAPFDREA